MKAAIYIRCSRRTQDTDVQERICREYCQRSGYEVYRVYQDSGESGMKDSRPAFNALLEDMRRYHFNIVVVSKLDRIGRSLQHLLSLFDEFWKLGVHFVAATQHIDTSGAMGKLQLQILGAFAEFERNIISERTKEGIKDKPNVGKRGPDKKPRKKRGVLRPRLMAVPEEVGT
jgi:DNA invertase Pin-like site-specific DNA recombinase